MQANDSRGQETPARRTTRLCTDGGTTTVYRTTGQHRNNRALHTDRDCPLLSKARSVDTREVETVEDDRLCPYCAGDEDWNQSDDDDWGYQRALAEAADVDGKIVTDGGTITACPECESASIKRRVPQKPISPDTQTHRWYCNACGVWFDEPIERAPRSDSTTLCGVAADLDAADPDAIPDGGSRLRSKADANTGRLSVAGVVGWPTGTEEYVDLGERLDDELPAPDRSEQERHARQAAHSLVAWSSRAGLDPGLVLGSVCAELPRGGDSA
jgi:hypothetical protein